MSETPLLEVRGLHVFYGHVHAVRGVSLTVRRGQIAALIGPNGAGKSSTLNAIAGLLRPAAGEVLLDGQPLARLPAHRVARSGAVLVPEGRGILQRMTVEENLKVAAEMHPGRDLRERIDGQLRRFPSLERRRDLPAGLDEAALDCLFADDAGVVLDVGRCRHGFLEQRQLGAASHPFQDAELLQLGRQGDVVDRLTLPEEVLGGPIDVAVVLPVEVLGMQELQDLGDREWVEKNGSKHRHLGI